MRSLKEVLVEIHGSGHIGCVITDEEIRKLKDYFLELVGEDLLVDTDIEQLEFELLSYNEAKQEIRDRINNE